MKNNEVEYIDEIDYHDFDELECYWEYYEGKFSKDKMNGKGKMTFKNKEYFEGYFINGLVDGEGIFSKNNGENVFGLWKDNKLITLNKIL